MQIQDIAKFLINPLLYIFFGMILLIFLKKKQKLVLTLLLASYFYLISVTFTGHIFYKVWRMDDTFDPERIYDAVVVLAGVSDGDWHNQRKELPYIPHNFFAVTKSSDKIFAGMYFVKSGHAKLLLMGEWLLDSYNEAKAVMKLASEMGLKENQVRIYGRVYRTLDEVEGVKRYSINHKMNKFLLIATDIDMRRAAAMFRKEGLKPDLLSVDKEKEKITWKSFIPRSGGIIKTENCLYEFVAYLGYYFEGNL
jgi:uncharacterized SAM-binding protein YcdF (DUF218 family)